ncbi:MAG: peptidase S8, partial [Alphaproteobacteria bacterium]
GNGLVIIAGAMDDARNIASFSDRAGSSATSYLTALGVRVRTIDNEGVGTLWSGTSFSAPIVTGAAALLASAFPNLTGKQIVQLLLTTADDAGDAGTDAIFGRGILNITRAMSPQGQTTVAGNKEPVSTTDNGSSATPMGDARMAAGDGAGIIILDGYSRPYAMNLASALAAAPQEHPLAQGLQGSLSTAGAVAGRTAVSITVSRNLQGQPQVGLAQLGLTYEDSRKAKILSGYALSRLDSKTAFAMGFSESGRTLQQRLQGRQGDAFLVARDPMTRMGFYGDQATSLGARHDLGPVAVTVTGERGLVWTPGPRRTQVLPGYSIAGLTLDRKIGPATLTLGGTRLREESTVFGGQFSSALATGGASSWFVDATAAMDIGRGWGAFASYRRGWTSLPGNSALVDKGRFSSDAWAFDLSKRGALLSGDRLAFRVMQPLRVVSGGLALNAPISYDYATGAVGYGARLLSLAPAGREVDFEAAYGIGLLQGRGYLSANAFLRQEPGHIEAMQDDVGGAIRFTLGF